MDKNMKFMDENFLNFYKIAIERSSNYIRHNFEDISTGNGLNAFEISSALSIIFDKPKEEIIVDIIKAN